MNNIEYNDENFGMVTACEVANQMMKDLEVSDDKAPSILKGILQEWPKLYTSGDQSRSNAIRFQELKDLIRRLCISALVIIACIWISGMKVDASEVNVTSDTHVYKRDAQFSDNYPNVYETLKDLVKAVKAEYDYVHNVTTEITDVIYEVTHHPFQAAVKTKIGTVLLLFVTLFLIVGFGWFIRLIFHYVLKPFCNIVVRIILPIFTFLFDCIKGMKCTMMCCATFPFVTIRDKFYRYQLYRKHKKMIQVVKNDEFVPFVMETSIRSDLFNDENGMYVRDLSNNRKIYVNTAPPSIIEMSKLSLLSSAPAIPSESSFKESLLPFSTIYYLDKVPPFVGTFRVGNAEQCTVIGMFSRILFKGKHCILTAAHVLESGKGLDLELCNKEIRIRASTIPDVGIEAYSAPDQLDFAVLSVPEALFSKLQLKVGKVSSRIIAGTPVRVLSYRNSEQKFGFSSGVMTSYAKSYHVAYKLSTLRGSSGSPILSPKNEILGIHIETDLEEKVNVGVVPPIFRTSQKESDFYEDLLQQSEYYSLSEDEEEDDTTDDEYYDEYFKFMVNRREDYDRDKEQRLKDEGLRSWGEILDELDESRDYYQEYKAFLHRGREGQHKGSMVKRNVRRKESPLICPQCGQIYQEGYRCFVCKRALVKDNKPSLDTIKAVATELPLPATATDKIQTSLIKDYLIQAVRDSLAAENSHKWWKEELEQMANKISELDIKISSSLVDKIYPLIQTKHESNQQFLQKAEKVDVSRRLSIEKDNKESDKLKNHSSSLPEVKPVFKEDVLMINDGFTRAAVDLPCKAVKKPCTCCAGPYCQKQMDSVRVNVKLTNDYMENKEAAIEHKKALIKARDALQKKINKRPASNDVSDVEHRTIVANDLNQLKDLNKQINIIKRVISKGKFKVSENKPKSNPKESLN